MREQHGQESSSCRIVTEEAVIDFLQGHVVDCLRKAI